MSQRPPRGSDAAATPFGKYELLERLGAGGMAVVYRARYVVAPGISKPVVIKRVLGHYAEDPAFVEMFVHEARVSVGLNHGNIVQVFDFGQVQGEYYLAMELVEGQPLSALLKKAQALGLAQLPPPLAVHVAMEMCKGLHHAHTRTDERGRSLGLVHRDISPDNVLVSYEGEVKISDFGIAKAQLAGRPVTASGVVKGKVSYLSPEQACAEQELDARSDVYAVGVVLYRMLCGRLPTEGTEYAVMHSIVEGRLTPPRALNPQLDDELVGILQDALATDREERIPDMEALHLRLSQWKAVLAPLFPVHTLKHLTGLLCEAELTAQGRPPQLPPEFRPQVTRWCAQQKRKPPAQDVAPTPWPPAGTGPEPTRSGRRGSRPSRAAPPRSAPPEIALEFDGPPAQKAPAVTAAEPRSDVYEKAMGVLMNLPNWRLLVAGAVIGVMLFKLTVWYFGWGTPVLVIRSDPPGALVSIDRTFIGVTPLELSDLSRSQPHTLELTQKGMKVWSRRFEPGTLAEQLDVTLEPVNPLQKGP